MYSCKETPPKTQERQKDVENELNTLMLGTSDDSLALRYFNVLSFQYLFGHNYEDANIERNKDSIIIDLVGFKDAQLIEIMAFGKEFYDFKVFVTPGDSINFNLKNGVFKFDGVNADHYNFFNQDAMIALNWPAYKGDILKYKEECTRVYTKKKNLFKDYVLRNNKVSKKYITTVNAELKFEYYHNLMSPRDGEMGSEEIFFNNPDGIYSAINREFNSKENGFFDATKYFENISFDEFKRPDLINNSYYKQSLVDYIRNYFVSQDYLHYNEESFLRELKFIDDNLDGELANYAKVHVISDYYKKGFGITSKNRALLKKTIEKVKKEYGENLYSEKLTDISSDLELAKNDFTAKVLKVKLLNIKGDTILFKDVLKENSHDVKILDFWASWCVPCIEDIKSTTTFKKELKNENNVDFIYLSIDANKDQWRSRSLELKNYFQTENQYLLVEGDKSAIAKYLKVTFIPRYAILNKSNNIEYARAPKPSDSLVFKKLILNVNR